MRNSDGKTIDWSRTEQRAQSMTNERLWAALCDIQKTLPHADAIDIAQQRQDAAAGCEGWRGGYYRDEASVYHKEMADRRSR